MKKILLDTNVILDFALKREPFYLHSIEILRLINNDIILGFVTATTITDIYYIAAKSLNKDIAREFIISILDYIEVLEVNKITILDALHSNSTDFEDAIQIKCAEFSNIDAIITRNKQDFQISRVSIFSPEEFLKQIF